MAWRRTQAIFWNNDAQFTDAYMRYREDLGRNYISIINRVNIDSG